MPKAKPSLEGGVIVHRIELGTWERQRIQPLAAGLSLSAVAKGVSAVLVAGTGVYVAFKTYGTIQDGWDEVKSMFKSEASGPYAEKTAWYHWIIPPLSEEEKEKQAAAREERKEGDWGWLFW